MTAWTDWRTILTTCGMGVVAVVTASSSAFADHLVLNNGDRLTGRVVAASTADVSLDTELAGRVTIKWTGVAQMNGRSIPADLDLATVRSLVPTAPARHRNRAVPAEKSVLVGTVV